MRGRTGMRAQFADRAHGGVVLPLGRACPRCGAGQGQSCRSTTVGGKVRGRDTGGGYVKRIKSIHRERRQ